MLECATSTCSGKHLNACSTDPLVAHLQNNVDEIRKPKAADARASDDAHSGRSSSSSQEKDREPSRDFDSYHSSNLRPRSAIDPKMAEAFRRDLERERARRMKEIEQAVAAKRASASARGKNTVDRSFWQQRRAQLSRSFGSVSPPREKSAGRRIMKHRAEAASPPRRPASVRSARGPHLRQWMNEHCSVAAGERMYSEAMRKIAERRHSVVRAAMDHVASIKSKGRAAGPNDAEFSRLYNPPQYRAVPRPRSEQSPPVVRPRPRSAPRPMSSGRLNDESSDFSHVLESQRSSDINGRPRVSFNDEVQHSSGRSKSVPRARAAPRALLQDPDDEDIAASNSQEEQPEGFNRTVSEQSTVFQRLYDAAERRKEKLEEQRNKEKKIEQQEARRMSNVSQVINPRSRAMAEISRGNQNVFARLYDEGKKTDAKKEEDVKRAASQKQQQDFVERASEYDRARVLEPFQPDIGPAARQYQRKGKLLDELDYQGKRKKQELLLRDAVQRAQAMEGCTFQPHISAKSRKIANRNDKSVYEDLYEDSRRRQSQHAGKHNNTRY